MTEAQRTKIAALKALLAADDVPMPHEALIGAVRNMVWPSPHVATVESAIKDLETERLIAGEQDALEGSSWTLTLKGKHRARTL